MADTKVSALCALCVAGDCDQFAIIDVGCPNVSKRITWANLKSPITPIGTHQMWLSAKGFDRGLTNIPGSISSIEMGSEAITWSSIRFPADHQSEVFIQMAMPENWDESTINYKVYWTADAGTACDVVSWKMSGYAYADNDVLGVAQTETEIEVTDSWLANCDLHITAQSGDVTVIGSPAAGELIALKFQRDTADASCTLEGDAIFLGLMLEYTIDEAVSAG